MFKSTGKLKFIVSIDERRCERRQIRRNEADRIRKAVVRKQWYDSAAARSTQHIWFRSNIQSGTSIAWNYSDIHGCFRVSRTPDQSLPRKDLRRRWREALARCPVTRSPGTRSIYLRNSSDYRQRIYRRPSLSLSLVVVISVTLLIRSLHSTSQRYARTVSKKISERFARLVRKSLTYITRRGRDKFTAFLIK